MDRAEAKKWFAQMRPRFKDDTEIAEALDLAIEALGDAESATTTDCISRADIEYHTQLEANGNGQYEEVEVAYKSDIDNLPPVNQKQITGKLESVEIPTETEEESTIGQPKAN